MDRVYRGAEITIVAAVGTGPSEGLLGISSARQLKQAHVTIDSVNIVSVFDRPWDEVRGSPWHSRAWTYQESLFARRRLFFTECQAIFDCKHEWISESTASQSKRIKDGDSRYVKPALDSWIDDQSGSQIYHLINQYNTRTLSFRSDILNAFSGTFRAFQGLESPVQNHCGVPLLREPTGLLDSFLVGLRWEWHGEFSLSSRREGFPSWSWTGWENASEYPPAWKVATNCTTQSVETTVGIELLDGTTIPWTNFEQQVVQRPTHTWTSPFIWIEALSIKFVTGCRPTCSHYKLYECSHYDWYEKGACAMTKRDDGASFYWNTRVSRDGECMGISLGDSANCLLLISETDGYWERVGLIKLGDFCERSTPGFYSSSLLDSWEKYRWVVPEKRRFRLG